MSVACADLAVDAVDGSLHGRVHQLEDPPQLSAAMAIQGHGLRLQSAHSQILGTQIHIYTLKVMQMMGFFNNAATVCLFVCMYVCMHVCLTKFCPFAADSLKPIVFKLCYEYVAH